MSYRLKYAENEVRYKLERAKYYDEGMTRVQLVEFLSDLLDNLDADDIEDTIISKFEDTCHDECVSFDERDESESKLLDEIEALKEDIQAFKDTGHDECVSRKESYKLQNELENEIFKLEETIKELEREAVTV